MLEHPPPLDLPLLYDYNYFYFTVPPPTPPPRCFPASAKVNLENGKTVEMSQLHTGDQVQIGKQIITVHNSSCGKVIFSQACVKNSAQVGRCLVKGVCMTRGDMCGKGVMHGKRGVHGEGVCIAGGMHGGGHA